MGWQLSNHVTFSTFLSRYETLSTLKVTWSVWTSIDGLSLFSRSISRLFIIFEKKWYSCKRKPKKRTTFWRLNESPSYHGTRVRNCQILTSLLKLVYLHCFISLQISRLFGTFGQKLYLVKRKPKVPATFWRLNEPSSCHRDQVRSCQIVKSLKNFFTYTAPFPIKYLGYLSFLEENYI